MGGVRGLGQDLRIKVARDPATTLRPSENVLAQYGAVKGGVREWRRLFGNLAFRNQFFHDMKCP